jgi:hypothetical protein
MKKYRIYIDEVGNNDLKSSNNPNHRYLSLTGIIFELEYAKNILRPTIENLKQKYFDYHPDDPPIFHRKELINKKYPFQNLKHRDVEQAFNNDFLKILKELEFSIISVLIDKLEHQTKYQTWKYDPYHYCMEIIIERFYFFLQNNTAVGDVMFESRGGKEDIRLKKSFSKIWESGTHYIDSDRLQKMLTSKQLKIQPKKLNITGLQVADLLAHPARRMMFKMKKIEEGKKFVFGDQIIEIMKSKYYNIDNSIYGYGIKFLP